MSAFQDADGPCVDIVSSWRGGQGELKSVQCQASLSEPVDGVTQTDNHAEIATQTAPPQGQEAKFTDEAAQFVLRVAPVIEEALRENTATAFEATGFAGDLDDELLSVGTVLACPPEPTAPLDTETVHSCADAAWNCNGTVLAVGYGRLDHSGWCDHRSQLRLWNLMSAVGTQTSKTGTTPSRELETQCCVSCVAFHPEQPSILAAGLFTGEILVWDLNDTQEPLKCRSTIDDLHHREPISSLSWVKDISSRHSAHLLVSVGGDGKMLYWSTANNLTDPVRGFLLTPHRQYHGQGTTMNRFPVVGGSGLGFSVQDPSTYVVGTEGGGLLKCTQERVEVLPAKQVGEFRWSANARGLLDRSPADQRVELQRHVEKYARLNGLTEIKGVDVYRARPSPQQLYPYPSNFAYQAHSGPVYGVVFSPFHRNVFYSCSTDASLRVNHALKREPLVTLEPCGSTGISYVNTVTCSPSRPTVVACGDSRGHLHIYDLQESMLQTSISRVIHDNAAVTAAAFNPRDGQVLATTSTNGAVHLWRLSEKLSSLRPGELQLIESMGSVSNAEDDMTSATAVLSKGSNPRTEQASNRRSL